VARRTLVAVALVAFTLAPLAPRAGAQGSPEQELADRYAPIMLLKQQTEDCDSDGEPYQPAPVEIVFGDPEVFLKTHDEGDAADPVTAIGPAAPDLARAPANAYFDLPGKPRDAGCTYERHSKQRMAELTPTAYAHIVVDSQCGQLALQYWFYYSFKRLAMQSHATTRRRSAPWRSRACRGPRPRW